MELSIRYDLLGLEGIRTGYVEGLYVVPEVRHTGLARRFLGAARNWAQDHGCRAFASDRADRVIVDRRFVSGE